MFVTCLFAILEPETGRIVLANAGHNLPYVRTDEGVIELRATGMPLGLMPDIRYEETEGVIAPGSNVLLYSDGLVEAHDPAQEMYGFPRLRDGDGGRRRRERAARPAARHAPPVHRPRLGAGGRHHARHAPPGLRRGRRPAIGGGPDDAVRRIVTAFSVPGEEGNERLAMDRVAASVDGLGLAPARLERLKTAVSEATMNAIEYGSQGRPEVPVDIVVETTAGRDRRPDHRPRAVRARSPTTPRRPISSASWPASRSHAAGDSS